MIAVVVPSIRPDCLVAFREAWKDHLNAPHIKVFEVLDGDDPEVVWDGYTPLKRSHCPQEWRELCFDHTDSCRNLGFLVALKEMKGDLDIIVTLDDDVRPIKGTDPIGDHDMILKEHVPISWFSTTHAGNDDPVHPPYMRGFPYAVRDEAEVWVSHGVWTKNLDWDAPTELVRGQLGASLYKGPIPKGVLTNICGMNLAWVREAIPFVYYAPMGDKLNVHRFGDIWAGIRCKRAMDVLGKAVVTGYSVVEHSRASDVFKNLEQEARGIGLNERWWSEGDSVDPYFEEYHRLYTLWQQVTGAML